MKRKIALALAAVVAIATIVPMNVFAVSNNYASGAQVTNYGSGYQFADPGKALPPGSTLNSAVPLSSGDATAAAGSALGNNAQGTALTVAITGQAVTSTQPRSFQVTLANAEWSFYAQTGLINMNGTTSSPRSDNTYWQELIPTNNAYIQSLQPLHTSGQQVSGNVTGYTSKAGQQTNLASDSVLNNTALDIRALFNMSATYGAQGKAGAAFSDGYDFTNPTVSTLLPSLHLQNAPDNSSVLTLTPSLVSSASATMNGAGTTALPYTGTDLYNIVAASYNANAGTAALKGGNAASDILAYYYLALYQLAQLNQTTSTQATLPMTAADMATYMGNFGADATTTTAIADALAVVNYTVTDNTDPANPLVTPGSAPNMADYNTMAAGLTANETAAITSYGDQAKFTAAMAAVNGSAEYATVVPVVDTTGTVNAPSAEANNYAAYWPATWNYSNFVSQVGGVVNNVPNNTNYSAVPYSINVTGATTAIITIYGNTIANQSAVVIPFCAISTGTGAITATIVSATAEVSGGVVNLSAGGTAGCTVALDQSNTIPAQYRIALGNVTITEQQLKLINSGSFYIDAPVGYHFVNDSIISTPSGGSATSPTAAANMSTANTPVTVSVNPELYLSSPATMTGNMYAWRNYNGNSYDPLTDSSVGGVSPSMAPNSTAYATSSLFYPSTQNSRLYFNINVVSNGSVFGSVVLSGLIIAQDNPSNTAYNQTLTMNINDANSSTMGGIGMGSNGGAGINQVSFTSRQQFGLSYTLVNANPVNAYSGWRNMGDIQPWSTNLSQLANNAGGVSTPITVLFQENTPNSWFSNQDTTFTLTDANGNALTDVKFSTVGVMTNNITNAIGNWSSPSYNTWSNATATYDQRYAVNSTNNVLFNAANNSIDLFDLSKALNSNGIAKLAAVQMQFTLSANPGFTGDVYLTVANQGTSLATTSIKVATFRSPITVTTTTTIAQIGYQSYNVADVSFTEDIPGLIQSGPYNNTVNMYLGEYGSGQQTPYMYFAPVTASDISVTPANCGLTVSNLGISGNANTSATGSLTNNISFNINSSSTTPTSSTDTNTYSAATITVSNLVVNIDRNVPQGDYQIIVGGSAITDNCPIPSTNSALNPPGITNPNGTAMDFFGVGGFVAPTTFITIGTSGANVPFTSRVAVTAGSDTAMVGPTDNQTSFAMGCQAFIDPNTNRMMVPIRFAVAALGVDPSQVLWDANSHTCTIYTTEKMLTFVQGQSTMYVNNQPFTLQNDDGTYVMPNLYPASDGTYRMFIPFRALADAIGINVTWDGSTSTAVFNPTPDEWSAYQAALAAATPAPTATPAETPAATAATTAAAAS